MISEMQCLSRNGAFKSIPWVLHNRRHLLWISARSLRLLLLLLLYQIIFLPPESHSPIPPVTSGLLQFWPSDRSGEELKSLLLVHCCTPFMWNRVQSGDPLYRSSWPTWLRAIWEHQLQKLGLQETQHLDAPTISISIGRPLPLACLLKCYIEEDFYSKPWSWHPYSMGCTL